MKIRYTKGRSRFYLGLSIFWFIVLIVNIFYVESKNWVFWTYITLPIVFISLYIFEYINQYLTIEDGKIYRNSLFPKKLALNKIKTFKKSGGNYILETDQNKLKINPTIIDRTSLKELNRILADHHTVLQ